MTLTQGKENRPFSGISLNLTLFISVSVTIASLVTGTGMARCQESDSLCVHFSSKDDQIHLRLKRGYSINGVLPLTICDIPVREKWEMEIEGPGIERRRGVFSLDRNGNPDIDGKIASTILKNALIPGWGAISSGRSASGWTDISILAFTAGYFLKQESEYDDLHDGYESIKNSYESALTYEERIKAGEELYSSTLYLNVQNDHRKRILIVAAAMYGYQLLDPVLFNRSPGCRSEAGGSIVEIRGTPANRKKAFIHSLVCPGRGQFYQGKKTRCILFSGLTAAAGFYSLDRLNNYEEKTVRYDLDIRDYNDAVSLEEREFCRSRAARSWDRLEDARKDRNISYMVLAGLWGLNIIDTFFTTDNKDYSSDLGLELGPSGAALVLRF
ncbi:MAG: hypothetical protein JW814_07260 [Candidatus Krumholzibacteriota bacterium]|nr:hypothetical protein [Candidatus Krumholzibacteriota bacterium]